MKIGFDIQSTLGPFSGLGVYTRNILETVAPGHDTQRPCRYQDLEFYFFSQPAVKPWNTLQRLWWENVTRSRLMRQNGVDLLHVPAFSPPILKPRGVRLVTTVHDLIGMLFPNQRGAFSRFYWGKWLPRAVQNSDVLIADSENTKKDIIKHLQVPSEKIRVIYLSGHEGFRPGISAEQIQAVKAGRGIRGRYFLFVGTLEPRKNLSRTLQAFGKFQREHGEGRDRQLVVVGSKAFAHGAFYKELLEKNAVDLQDVIFTDYVGHEELNALYCGAEAFLYPSLYEGFGIPLLEAMGSGTPVIASRTSSVPEVAGDAALLVDPLSADEITNAMLEISRSASLHSELVNKGFLRIKKFSWAGMVRELISVYQSLA